MDEAETRRAPATKPALVPLRFEVMYRFHRLLSYTSGLVPLDPYLEKIHMVLGPIIASFRAANRRLDSFSLCAASRFRHA